RLTGSSVTTGPPAPPELAAQAARLLAAGDTPRYEQLFSRADEHEDPNRRYQARVLLLEAGLSAAAQASAERAARIFLAIAKAGTAALIDVATEPTILNYVGVAFYELWSLPAAQALFSASIRLDPGIPHVKRNLIECK